MRDRSTITRLSLCALLATLCCAPATADDRPRDFPTFFGTASVSLLANELPSGASLGNSARDDRNFDGHYNWARQTDPNVVLADLIEKFNSMAAIKLERGRGELASWYAKVCQTWAGYGLDFGGDAANARDRATHYNWAASSSTSLEAVRGEIAKRLVIIFCNYRNARAADLLRHSALRGLLGGIDLPGERDSSPSGDQLAEAVRGAMQSAADETGDSFPLPQAGEEMPWDPPAPGVAKIKDVRADPFYRCGGLVSGAKLFIIGWNLGARPGRAYIVFDKPVNRIIQINLEPFDSRGWSACWFDELVLARMPDLGRIGERTMAWVILELPNGQRVRDLVFVGVED